MSEGSSSRKDSRSSGNPPPDPTSTPDPSRRGAPTPAPDPSRRDAAWTDERGAPATSEEGKRHPEAPRHAGAGGSGGSPPGRQSGGSPPRADTDTYTLYRRGLDLLGRGSAAAAAQLLERAAAAEPESRSILEALGRAQFDTRHYEAAASSFRRIVEASPSDDYAQFGLGLALSRTGDHGAAAEHLALAAAMRPDLRHYTEALRSVRATLRAQQAVRTKSHGEGEQYD